MLSDVICYINQKIQPLHPPQQMKILNSGFVFYLIKNFLYLQNCSFLWSLGFIERGQIAERRSTKRGEAHTYLSNFYKLKNYLTRIFGVVCVRSDRNSCSDDMLLYLYVCTIYIYVELQDQ